MKYYPVPGWALVGTWGAEGTRRPLSQFQCTSPAGRHFAIERRTRAYYDIMTRRLFATLGFVHFILCYQAESFSVFWNVPTEMCHKYGINFEHTARSWHLQINPGDLFLGPVISILYDPGFFPALVSTSEGGVKKRNGGIPQLGDLQEHLSRLETRISRSIPDPRFTGLGIIDFEAWRPIFRQNWGTLLPYKKLSRDLEKSENSSLTPSQIEILAEYHWEETAEQFMRSTLELVKKLRPYARWGYYAYPYCYNFTKRSPGPGCPAETQSDNDKLEWLWEMSGAIFPSIYLREEAPLETKENRTLYVWGRLTEALRAHGIPHEIFPYLWYQYTDTGNLLSSEDLKNAVQLARDFHLGGVIIWGSSNDVNSSPKCKRLLNYLDDQLGPVISNFTVLVDPPFGYHTILL